MLIKNPTRISPGLFFGMIFVSIISLIKYLRILKLTETRKTIQERNQQILFNNEYTHFFYKKPVYKKLGSTRPKSF